MKTILVLKAIILGVIISAVTACSGSSSKNTNDNDYHGDEQESSSLTITFNGDNYEMVPLYKDSRNLTGEDSKNLVGNIYYCVEGHYWVFRNKQ